MDALQKLYLNIGDELFRCGNYKDALFHYQKAYELDGGCVDALMRIKSQYLLPQEENYQRNYSENCKVVGIDFEYENCKIDFIPVDDAKYVLFDQESESFCGTFDLAKFKSNETGNKTFQSILVADTWDARELLPILGQHVWNNEYIVLNDVDNKFMSFFKLPDFVSLLQEKIQIFKNTKDMRNYFETYPDAYLPHMIYAPNQREYETIVEDIHKKRIKDGIPSDNVFLSICIPSYNRGKLALEAVQVALKATYDAEIEVLVSNNGSYIGKEEYEAIRDMTDSRVRYFEKEKMEPAASNVCNCLENAEGHFAIIFSDEECLIVDRLGQLLDYLWNNQELGGFKLPDEKNTAGETVTNLKKFKQRRYCKGVEAINRALKAYYISGHGFNVEFLKQHDFLSKMDVYSQNPYEMNVVYPHDMILVFLARYLDFDDIAINCWFHTGNSPTGGYEAPEDGYGIVKQFALPENRFMQEETALKIIEHFLTFDDYKISMLERAYSTFSNISELFRLYGKESCQYNWLDIHIMHYKNCLKIMRESKWGIDAFDESFFYDLDEVFLDWLDCRRIRPLYSEEENLKAALRAQVARYCCEHGAPFLKIDFRAIDEKLDTVIGQALSKKQTRQSLSS